MALISLSYNVLASPPEKKIGLVALVSLLLYPLRKVRLFYFNKQLFVAQKPQKIVSSGIKIYCRNTLLDAVFS